MSLKLVGIGGTYADRHIAVDKLPVVLGRGGEADVLIDDRWASRRHCQLDRQGDEFRVRDLGSTHGTLVNGLPIREAVLAIGDRLSVGLANFVVHFASERSNTEAASFG